MPCGDSPDEFDIARAEAVCLACMGEPLRQAAAELLSEDRCSFCEAVSGSDHTPIAVPFDEFMGLIRAGLFAVYDIGSEVGNPPSDGGDGRRWFTSDEVAQEHCWDAVAEGPHADDLFGVIEYWVGEIDPWWTYQSNGWTKAILPFGWKGYKESVLAPEAESRYSGGLVPPPEEFIDKLLKMLLLLPGLICDLPTGSAFWRARPYDERTFPLTGKALGSAPTEWAQANRMSPKGVSMFYGSDELETAIAEVKYGDHPWAAAGQFRTACELRIVDLSSLPYAPSIFDPTQREDYHAIEFLWEFANDISQPVTNAAIDYRPTQALTADIRSMPYDQIDGIRYRSAARSGGTSYVLFFDNNQCGEADDARPDIVLRLYRESVHESIPCSAIDRQSVSAWIEPDDADN